jgi:hypothetical protein
VCERVKRWCRRVLFVLWPPWEASLADKQIAARNRQLDKEARWTSEFERVRTLVGWHGDGLEGLEAWATRIYESEANRKNTLESKAGTFVGGIGLAVSIVSVVPVLLADDWKVPGTCAWVAGVGYLLAIIYLLVGACHAIRVLRVESYVLQCADAFTEILEQGGGKPAERIAWIVASTKSNEDGLTRKANHLEVAKRMFLRGVFFVAFATVLSAGARLLAR